MELLEEEVERHRFFGHTLGLLLVRTATWREGRMERWFVPRRWGLRPVDRMGLYGQTAVEILLPEVTSEVVEKIARQVVARDPDSGPFFCGAALFPRAATSAQELLEVTRTAAHQATTEEPVRFAPATSRYALPQSEGIVAPDPAMLEVIATAERLAGAPVPVLITGETGAGKEVIAQILGGSPDRPLQCINCAAIPDELIESTMFGHEKGAFTGAHASRKGIFETASGGAVLLDEIGELSPSAQAALLRVLDTKRITRVGSSKEIEVNVRVISATHRDLEAMCKQGAFRLDLLYRINTMVIQIPPLRDRPGEIAQLTEHFLRELCGVNGHKVAAIEPDALELLKAYPWPGNVRELRNVIHRAIVIADGTSITQRDLPRHMARIDRAGGNGREDNTLTAARGLTDPNTEVDFKTRIGLIEAQLIHQALDQAGWCKAEAARRLRIPLRTLMHKIRVHQIAQS